MSSGLGWARSTVSTTALPSLIFPSQRPLHEGALASRGSTIILASHNCPITPNLLSLEWGPDHHPSPSPSHSPHPSPNPDLQGAHKHDVVVLPLERILPHGLGATRVVKVDTQGFECKVLQGSMSNLRHLNSRVEVGVAWEWPRSHTLALALGLTLPSPYA